MKAPLLVLSKIVCGVIINIYFTISCSGGDVKSLVVVFNDFYEIDGIKLASGSLKSVSVALNNNKDTKSQLVEAINKMDSEVGSKLNPDSESIVFKDFEKLVDDYLNLNETSKVAPDASSMDPADRSSKRMDGKSLFINIMYNDGKSYSLRGSGEVMLKRVYHVLGKTLPKESERLLDAIDNEIALIRNGDTGVSLKRPPHE